MRSRLNRFLLLLFGLFVATGLTAQRIFDAGYGPLVWAGTFVYFTTMVGWMFGHRGGFLRSDSKRFFVLAWAGTIAMSIWSVFLLLSIPLGIFGGRSGLKVALGTAVGVAIVGLIQTRLGPKVRRVSVPIDGLSPELRGLKIALISDLHVGPTVRRRYVERVVKKVLACEPDLIAFTGDFADGKASSLKSHWEPLRELHAPLGLFYVPGNHEYYWDADEWIEAARQCGFTPLLNENRVVARGNAKLLVGGVPDPMAAYFRQMKSDPGKAAAGGESANLKILLAHRPETFEAAAKAGFHLQLSGHTHAGQYLPFNLFMPFFHKYYRGLNRHAGLWLYVNAGTGYWGPPNRFGIPSEITLLTLV